MPEQNSTNGSHKTSVTMGLELEVTSYAMVDSSPEGVKAFVDFYHTKIHDWLMQRNVASTRAWIVGDKLIVLSTPGMPPWSATNSGIKGLEKYLKLQQDTITPLLTLNLHPTGWKTGDGGTGCTTETAVSAASNPDLGQLQLLTNRSRTARRRL